MSALAGSRPDYPIPAQNLVEFLYSDPFAVGSSLVVPSHKPGLPSKIAESKTLLLDPATGGGLTRGELISLALRYADGFRYRLGLCPTPFSRGEDPILSPVVLVHLPNCLQYIPLVHGVIAAGLTLTVVNSLLTPTEVSSILRKSRPAAIITSAPHAIAEAVKLIGDRELAQRYERFVLTLDPQDIDFDKTVGEDDHRILLKAASASHRYRIQPMSENETKRRVAAIYWSSGTGGQSKGVLQSHYSLVAGICNSWHGNRWQGADQGFLGFAPFFHIYGWYQFVCLGISIGALTVIMRRFDFKEVLGYIGKHRITLLHISPPVGVLLAKSPLVESVDLTAVRCMSGGAPLDQAVIEAVYNRTGVIIRMGYGTTEHGSLSCQQGDDWDEIVQGRGTAGTPLPGVEFKIVSVDGKDTLLKLNEEGEILLRTPGNMLGYLDNKAANDETFAGDKWLRTGDIGLIDERGQIKITDRLKDVIKVSGFQVTPAELEGALCSSSLVADAGVCGIPDPARASEKPRGWIVLSEEGQRLPRHRLADALRKETEAKLIRYKWVTGNVRIVDVIPKSVAGKILRRDLKALPGEDLELYAENGQRLGEARL